MEIPKTINNLTLVMTIAVLVLICIAWRLIPHIPNFAPIGALAIVSGLNLHRKHAFLVPLSVMIISDSIIGLYNGFLWTWLSVAAIVLIGTGVRKLQPRWQIALGALGSSFTFFIISNFGVWVSSGMYSHTLSGILECFTMAIPFFRNTLISDAIFTTTFIVVISVLKNHPVFNYTNKLNKPGGAPGL